MCCTRKKSKVIGNYGSCLRKCCQQIPRESDKKPEGAIRSLPKGRRRENHTENPGHSWISEEAEAHEKNIKVHRGDVPTGGGHRSVSECEQRRCFRLGKTTNAWNWISNMLKQCIIGPN
jgi:hypothetical protein